MLRDIVLRQKKTKGELLSREYVFRDKLNDSRKWVDSELVKVVLGPRRAGKSVFSLLLLKDRDFAYFNFDDEGLPDLNNFPYEELLSELASAYGKTKYMYLDEIQNLPKWELFVNRLHREGYNLTVTGSNSRLLSRELATALTGRHLPIEILPFSFREYQRAKGGLGTVEDYMVNGGYPDIVVNKLDTNDYLDVLYDSLLFKDIVKRHNVRFSGDLDKLGLFLMSNFTGTFSSRRLKNILGFKSDKTVGSYVGFLEEAYLFISLGCYSPKASVRVKTPQKIYALDNGFIKAKAVQSTPDFGKLMENLVFTELLKRGFEPGRTLFYYRTRNGREIDFVLKEGVKIKQLVQVCYDLSDQETRKRENKAISEAAGELHPESSLIIDWRNISDWLTKTGTTEAEAAASSDQAPAPETGKTEPAPAEKSSS